MPFKSDKQRKWMWANDPEMAKKWEKEEQKEAVQVDVNKVLKNPKIKQLLKRLGIRQAQSYKAAMKILNYLANNPHALSTIKHAFESVKEERDYKAEYKKYGSSTKAKKYRAELNKYNRQKGTYGNGDGKDASHKGGKIVGFEAESKNRGRAEKSRLKKESTANFRSKASEKVLKFTDIKDSSLARHLKAVTKKIGAELEKISGGFQVRGNLQDLTTVVDYVFDKSIKKGLMKGGGMAKINVESVEEMLNPPNYLDNQAPTPVNSPDEENLVNRGKRTNKSGQPKFGTFRNESVKGLGMNESVNESVKVRSGETAKTGKWEVYNPKTNESIKEVGNARAATRLMSRLMSSGQYDNVASRHVETYKKESIKEKISKDEWAQYPKYARKLKPYLQKLFKVPIRVKVIKQANHNPWIDVRVARFGKDIIPNDFRVKAAKVIGARGVRDWDNVNYGNIRVNSISLQADDWKKLLGNKVK